MMKKISGLGFIILLVCATPTWSITIDGIEFPNGVGSFADEVVFYSPMYSGGPPASPPFDDPTQAWGIPNHGGDINVPDFVSLGNGGVLILKFTDNALTGSNSAADDLWIFEIGPDVEDMYIWISRDGSIWESVGTIGGSVSGVDIDAFGFDSTDVFSYVKLMDDPLEGNSNTPRLGADIDAVGAISTVVPEPASLLLFGLGFGALASRRLRKKR